MNFHTIVQRELLIASKRRATFYFRAGVAATAIVVTLGLAQATVRGIIPATMTGRNLLWALGYLGLACALFEGISQTIDAISRERREGTLGLLFLSNFGAHDIVAGKAAAAGLRAFYALLAAAPAPAMTFLFGGVTLGDYARMLAALANALFFSLGLGLFLSSLSVSRSRAAGVTGAVLLWFVILAPAAGSMFYLNGMTLTALIVGASPTLPLLFLFDDARGATAFFSGALVFANIAAWLLFALAAWRLRGTWQVEPAMRAPIKPQANEAKENRPLSSFWASAAIASAVWAAIWIAKPGEGTLILYALTLLVLHGILSFDAAGLASRTMAEQRASGALELLLTTPLPEEEAVLRQLLACKRRLVAPVAVLTALGISMLFSVAVMAKAEILILSSIAYLLMLGLALLDLWLAVRGGVWHGLRTGNPATAMRRTMGGGNIAMLLVPACAGFGVFLLLMPFISKDTAMLWGIVVALVVFAGAVLALFGKSITFLTDRVRAAASDDLRQ